MQEQGYQRGTQALRRGIQTRLQQTLLLGVARVRLHEEGIRLKTSPDWAQITAVLNARENCD